LSVDAQLRMLPAGWHCCRKIAAAVTQPMEPDMSEHTDLIDRYIAAWNETDAPRRKALIARTWTEGASYLDPLMNSEGHAGIDAMIAGVQAKFPGFRFSLSGKVDAFQDRVRFSWELGPQNGPAVVKGTDFAVVADNRLQAVTGFLDQVPAAAA
jgi:hypothetical protein